MKKTTRKQRGVASAFLMSIVTHFRREPQSDVCPHDFGIIDQPSPADIARARELIEQYGWTHLLRR